MSALGDWYKARSNAFKAAINTAWQSFIATFGIALLGFLGDVAKWSDGSLDTFPAISPLGKAVVAAAVAAASFILTFTIRGAQAAKNPDAGPKYDK
jgi:hypothetical protein